MNESTPNKTREWLEAGTMLLVLLMSVAGPQVRKPRPSPARLFATLAPWVGVAITLIAFLLNATWQAAKVDSALAEQRAEAVATNARIQQLSTSLETERERRSESEDKVQFLCNERRRDNAEAGRHAEGAAC